MKVSVEKLEHNMAVLTVEVPEDTVEEALQKAYLSQRKRISVPGFRKGKVPRQLIEKMYGPEVFYEEAGNYMIDNEYPKAYDESGLEIVSSPEIEVKEMEKGKPFVFTAKIAVKPEVTLGKYKGIEVTKIDTTVSDEEVQTEIDNERKKNARIITKEGPAALSDTAIIDFEGSVDGVPFEGGKSENYELELGSHSFIDTFEDQIVGKSAGDEFDVNVTFPEDYNEKSLAGKPAVFAVKLKEVKTRELSPLDDEYVSETTDFETVEEYKKSIKDRLTKEKEDTAKGKKEDEAVEKLVSESTMDIPDAMIEFQTDSELRDYSYSLMRSGLKLSDYLKFSGETVESIKERIRPNAKKRIEASLVLEAVAKAEGFTATDEDVDEKLKETAERNGLTLDEIKENVSDSEKKTMKRQIEIEKAIDFILENAKEKAPKKTKKDSKDKAEV